MTPIERAPKLAPLAKRVYLTGVRPNYEIILRDNNAERIIARIPVPTAGIGFAAIRGIKAYAAKCNGRFF